MGDPGNGNLRRWGLRVALMLAMNSILALPAGAQAVANPAAESHAHVPLLVDAALDWPRVIETALAAHPQSAELIARAVEADAWQRRGRQWLAAAPALYFSYLSDRSLDDFGQRQYDSGVELPLWWAGQRSAVQTVAASVGAESAAAAAALRLEVTGLLRGILWDIAAAANGVAAARDALTVAQDLVRGVERRHERGDLPRADVLLAKATLLERQQGVVEAEALFLDAERNYRSLTGLDARPAEFAEAATDLDELGPGHPLIALADAAVARTGADQRLAERDVRAPMVLTVGPHREIDPGTTLPRDSVNVGFRLPVGGKAHGVAQVAHSARLAAAAVAERGQLVRRLDLDLHEAEHALTVLGASIALTAERDALAAEQLTMAQLAFAQGEIELRELLRIQESALAARRDLERLHIEQQRTIAARNQALGVTP